MILSELNPRQGSSVFGFHGKACGTQFLGFRPALGRFIIKNCADGAVGNLCFGFRARRLE